jgi:hypothetical protein
MPLQRALRTVSCLALLCGLLACDDLRQFKTGPHTVFRGEVVGSDSDPNGGSFIRQGFASHTQLELSFDPTLATQPISADAGAGQAEHGPGTIDSYVCPSGQPQCGVAGRARGPFDHARLVPIENLAHDSLSQYTFPGGGRIRNYMFGTRFRSTSSLGVAERYAMIFISLMESGKIEVRAIAPNVLARDGQTELLPALFGVFVLERHRT